MSRLFPLLEKIEEDNSLSIEKNDYFFDPFLKDLNSIDYYFYTLIRSENPLYMYTAILKKIEDNNIEIKIDFGVKNSKIFMDRTPFGEFMKNEKLTIKDSFNFYKYNKEEIKKPFTIKYFEYLFLMRCN